MNEVFLRKKISISFRSRSKLDLKSIIISNPFQNFYTQMSASSLNFSCKILSVHESSSQYRFFSIYKFSGKLIIFLHYDGATEPENPLFLSIYSFNQFNWNTFIHHVREKSKQVEGAKCLFIVKIYQSMQE